MVRLGLDDYKLTCHFCQKLPNQEKKKNRKKNKLKRPKKIFLGDWSRVLFCCLFVCYQTEAGWGWGSWG